MYQGIESITTPFLGRKVERKLVRNSIDPQCRYCEPLKKAKQSKASAIHMFWIASKLTLFAMTRVGFARTQ